MQSLARANAVNTSGASLFVDVGKRLQTSQSAQRSGESAETAGDTTERNAGGSQQPEQTRMIADQLAKLRHLGPHHDERQRETKVSSSSSCDVKPNPDNSFGVAAHVGDVGNGADTSHMPESGHVGHPAFASPTLYEHQQRGMSHHFLYYQHLQQQQQQQQHWHILRLQQQQQQRQMHLLSLLQHQQHQQHQRHHQPQQLQYHQHHQHHQHSAESAQAQQSHGSSAPPQQEDAQSSQMLLNMSGRKKSVVRHSEDQPNATHMPARSKISKQSGTKQPAAMATAPASKPIKRKASKLKASSAGAEASLKSDKRLKQSKQGQKTETGNGFSFPKMPTSLFLLFSANHRDEVRRKNPSSFPLLANARMVLAKLQLTERLFAPVDVSFAGMSKILGKMWKNVGEAEKRELMVLHARQRASYEAQVQRLIVLQTKSFGQSLNKETADGKTGDSDPKNAATALKRGQQPAVKKLARPKRPTSAYLFFTLQTRQAIRDAHPDLGFTDVARALGVKWQKLTAEERAVSADFSTLSVVGNPKKVVCCGCC